jgi:hypothetical protein
MSRRLYVLFAIVAASGLIAVGCGDDDDNGDGNGGAATTQEQTAEDTGTAEAPDTGDEDVDAAVQQAIDACKQSVNAAPQLSAETKSDLEGLCEEAASGDIEDVQEASEEVCVKVIEETVPAGAAREQALSSCEAVNP